MEKSFKLFLGLLLLILFIFTLHTFSDRIPGPAGILIQNNLTNDLEVYSYVYTELGDIEEFIDDREGKYGKKALMEYQHEPD